VIIPTSVSDEEAKKSTRRASKTLKPYLVPWRNPSRVKEDKHPRRSSRRVRSGAERAAHGFWRDARDHRRRRYLGPAAIRARRRGCCIAALELGINFFDTADSYGPHASSPSSLKRYIPTPKAWSSAPRAGRAPRKAPLDPDGRPSICAGRWTVA